MVLKPELFNELGKGEIQGFQSRTEIQSRSNCDVSFNFLIYLILKLVYIY